MRPVAALYVDVARGPYAAMPGVDCWGVERDATTYAGPHPIVAHPPCGHWGRLKHLCKQPQAWKDAGPVAVAQVRQWGGLLEHPAYSRLWDACKMPPPNGLPDAWGGYTLAVNQTRWGHKARKHTWLYVVGVDPRSLVLPPDREPTHVICTGRRGGVAAGVLPRVPKHERHLTPPAFAQWLVDAARLAGVEVTA